MKRFLVALSLTAAGCATTVLPMHTRVVAPLDPAGSGVGAVYGSRDPSVSVAVTGPGVHGRVLAESYTGWTVDMAFDSERDGDAVDLFRTSAEEAARAFGFDEGNGATIGLAVDDFHVYTYLRGGPVNCVGYGNLRATISAPDGSVLAVRKLDVAYWDQTNTVWSLKEVQREALTRIYRQAAWEATAAVLAAAYPGNANPAALRRLLAVLDSSASDATRGTVLFWLGLTGQNDAAVRERLLLLFRTSREQRIREGAVEAIGMLGIEEARPDIEAILSGSRKVGHWDNQDPGEDWHLLRALYRMGQTDVSIFLPRIEGPPDLGWLEWLPLAPLKVTACRCDPGLAMIADLVRYQQTGEIPLTGAERQARKETPPSPEN